ncbi:MAG: hypothetical protein IJC09_00125 [Clostridia bacterium]|nr:hypothetical protein [Clostridia bacterium]
MNTRKFLLTKAYENITKIYEILCKRISSYIDLMENYPGEDENIKKFERKRFEEAREIATTSFWYSDEIYEKAMKVIAEVEEFINESDFFAPPHRWREMNPNLKYFDVAFMLIEESFDLYKWAKTGETGFKLKYFPTLEEYFERKQYFSEQNKICATQRLDCSENGFYKRELLNTLAKIFANDFEEYFERWE